MQSFIKKQQYYRYNPTQESIVLIINVSHSFVYYKYRNFIVSTLSVDQLSFLSFFSFYNFFSLLRVFSHFCSQYLPVTYSIPCPSYPTSTYSHTHSPFWLLVLQRSANSSENVFISSNNFPQLFLAICCRCVLISFDNASLTRPIHNPHTPHTQHPHTVAANQSQTLSETVDDDCASSTHMQIGPRGLSFFGSASWWPPRLVWQLSDDLLKNYGQ